MAQYSTAMHVWKTTVSGMFSHKDGRTDDAEGSNKYIRWRVVIRNHLRDEVCGHSDYGNK